MRVLDARALMDGDFEGVSSPRVAGEVEVPPNLEIIEPRREFIDRVRKAAAETGDVDVLSPADIEILALALQVGGRLVSDDFAVQNVAEKLGIEWESVERRIRKAFRWEWYCPACRKRHRGKQECEKCGTITKRRPKKQKDL